MTVPVPASELTVGRQGHYAGAVSRLVAFAVDVGASWGLYTIGVALFDTAFKLVTRRSYNLTNHQVVALVLLGLWEFLYFSYQWAVSGKTLGMAVFGLQVVTAEGRPISARQAVVRTLALALCLLTVGLAFLGIVFQRERRGLNDLIAGTAVVYSWDARAARLRWMARTDTQRQAPAQQPQLHEPGARAAS
ncbi:MAG TPA: RDD family protein [Acidimicrobiales bacterium]